MFEKQNFFFKIAFCLFASFQISSFKILLLLFLYFIISPKIFQYYFLVLLRFLPFFVVYLLFGLLFSLDYFQQIFFISKFSLFILLAVYLTKTTTLKNFLADISFLKLKYYNAIYYIISLIMFVNIIYNKRIEAIKDYTSVINRNIIKSVGSKSNGLISESKPRYFSIIANTYIVIYISTVSVLYYY